MKSKRSVNSLASIVGRIGLLLGGTSSERKVSLRSGEAIYRALTGLGFDVVKLDPARKGFEQLIRRAGIKVAFIALHGSGGEDGTVQSVLERLRIPFTGSGAWASALAFDKHRSKKYFQQFQIQTPRYSIITRRNWKSVMREWAFPLIVKPLQEGSSIGVRMIKTEKEKQRIIPFLLKQYSQLIVEEFICGREFSVPILDGEALPVTEIKSKRAFYDYKAKYTRGLTDYFVPAPIPKKVARKLQATVKKAYACMGLRDLARGDMMMNQDGNAYLLEMNSIPGFTETSLLPKAAQKIGIEFSELCTRLLQMASRRMESQHIDSR